MPTSIRRWALALACCFSSATAGLAAVAPAAAAERSLEMELELARTPKLYLVVDPAAGRLDVKIRGLVLDSVELLDAALLIHSQRARQAPAAALPAGWSVSSVPDDSRRRVLEAAKLKPYDGADPAAATQPAGPSATAEPEVHDPAASYRVPLENGWELRVEPSVRRSRLLHGPALTAARWRALGSHEAFRPLDVLALALAAEDARRIHHLFRPGVEILAVATMPPPSGGKETP